MTEFLDERSLINITPKWLTELSLNPDERTDLHRPALIVVDMQMEFLDQNGQLPVWGGPAIVGNVVKLIDSCQKLGHPIYFSRHICLDPHKHKGMIGSMQYVKDPEKFLCVDGDSSQIHKALPVQGSTIIDKYRYSAFYGSALDVLLRSRAVDTVIITGVATDICCAATAHDAFYRDYRVVFCLDGTGGTSEEAHLSALKNVSMAYGRLATTAQILGELERQMT